jgi:uncharacterized membrane protein (UPF0127 family)
MVEEEASSTHSHLEVVNASKDGAVVAACVEWAGTSAVRRRGLLGRDRLDWDEAMYIVPTQWIHTFRMRFPIDIAFLSRAGQVLALHHSLKPNRLSKIVLRAEGALELPAGKLRATNTEVGDILEFMERDGLGEARNE